MQTVISIPVKDIEPDPAQPRKEFDEEALDELAKSIRQNGLLQPIAVRPVNGHYQLIAGERRWRAVQMIGWVDVPSIVWDISDLEAKKLQILENIVRRDLNPVEEAWAYKGLQDEGMDVREIADIVGKKWDWIQAYIEILRCRPDILHLVAHGQLGVNLAWQLSQLSHNSQMTALRKIQHLGLDTQSAVMLCQQLYMQENQAEMFEETKLEAPQIKAARQVKDAMQKACEAFQALQGQEGRLAGGLGEAVATEYDLILSQIAELRKCLNWLETAVKQRRVSMFVEDN